MCSLPNTYVRLVEGYLLTLSFVSGEHDNVNTQQILAHTTI